MLFALQRSEASEKTPHDGVILCIVQVSTPANLSTVQNPEY